MLKKILPIKTLLQELNLFFAVKVLVQARASLVLLLTSLFRHLRMHLWQFWRWISLLLMVERLELLMDIPNFANTFCSKPFVQIERVVLICTKIARKKKFSLPRTWIEKRNYSLNVKSLPFKCQKLHKWLSLSTETCFSTSETCLVIGKITNICYPKLKASSKTKIWSKI